jgi:hypothetical protein
MSIVYGVPFRSLSVSALARSPKSGWVARGKDLSAYARGGDLLDKKLSATKKMAGNSLYCNYEIDVRVNEEKTK